MNDPLLLCVVSAEWLTTILRGPATWEFTWLRSLSYLYGLQTSNAKALMLKKLKTKTGRPYTEITKFDGRNWQVHVTNEFLHS